MNSKVFKQFIQEAVRQAVREELKQLLAEHAASQLITPQYTQRPIINEQSYTPSVSPMGVSATQSSNNISQARIQLKNKMDSAFGMSAPGAASIPTPKVKSSSVPELKITPNQENAIASLLAETAQSITAMDIAGIRNHNGE